MCECIAEVEKKVALHQEVEKAGFVCKTLVPANRLFGEVEYTPTSGRKKYQKVNIIFKYCPICGKKYPDWD